MLQRDGTVHVRLTSIDTYRSVSRGESFPRSLDINKNELRMSELRRGHPSKMRDFRPAARAFGAMERSENGVLPFQFIRSRFVEEDDRGGVHG
jgi:hypothetical protein